MAQIGSRALGTLATAGLLIFHVAETEETPDLRKALRGFQRRARKCLRLLPPTAVGDKAQTEQRSSQKTEAAGLGDFRRPRAGSHDIARNARTTGVIGIDIRANVRTKEETLGVLGEVSEGYIIDRE